MPKVLNAMNYDIFILGNHEFNFGMTALDEILKDMKAKQLTANFYHKDGKRYIEPTTIIEKDGVKLGIIGLTTPMSAKFEEDTGHLKNMKFSSPSEEAKVQIKALKEKGVDAIVVLAHIGIENENNIPDTGVADLVNNVEGIDVIIVGHMHKNVSSETIKDTVVTEPHRYGTVVSEVDLTFDVGKDGKVKLLSKTAKTVPVKDYEADPEIVEIYKPYHEELRRLNNVTIGQSATDMVPQERKHGVSVSFLQDTGLSSLITDVERHYSNADVVSFYFDTIQPGDTKYRYNAERKKSKYVTFDIFGGVSYNIDLRKPSGEKIVDLKLADGTPVTDDMKIKLGMNSYRFGQMTKKGGIWEGQQIPTLWESKVAMGQEKGTIQNMMIDYITNVKKGKVEGVSHNHWKIIGL